MKHLVTNVEGLKSFIDLLAARYGDEVYKHAVILMLETSKDTWGRPGSLKAINPEDIASKLEEKFNNDWGT